jgi:hypothetical protein
MGGPVGTGCCGRTRWRGWLGFGWSTGAEPPPNRLGGIDGTMTDATNVRRTMAVTMTALGTATPAGCARAAATTDREVVCMIEKLAFC